MPLSAKMLQVHCDYITALAALFCLEPWVCHQPCRQCDTKAISMLICINRRIVWSSHKAEGPKRVVTRHHSDK